MANAGTPGTRGLRGRESSSADADATDDGAARVLTSPASTLDPESQSWTLAKSIFPVYTIRRTVPEVRFQFSVADEHGRLVTGLSANDVRIFDNQSVVQRIRQFSRMEDLPLQLGILLDVSDSVQKNVAHEKRAAQVLVQQVSTVADRSRFSHGVRPRCEDMAALDRRFDRHDAMHWRGFNSSVTPPTSMTVCLRPVSAYSRKLASRMWRNG